MRLAAAFLRGHCGARRACDTFVPGAFDAHAANDLQSTCDPTPKPGGVAVMLSYIALALVGTVALALAAMLARRCGAPCASSPARHCATPDPAARAEPEDGFEPTTYRLQGGCSGQLSYSGGKGECRPPRRSSLGCAHPIIRV
jgi:hypothetical protein